MLSRELEVNAGAMSGHRHRSPFILLAVFLLLVVTLGCSCGQVAQEWLTQFLQDLTRAIELWIREQIARFIANLQQQIVDWWNGLLRDIQQGVEDVWREIRQGATDLWSSLFPPAPEITEPVDGLIAAGANLKVRGTARPDGTVTLFCNGVFHRTAKADAAGRWKVDDVLLNKGENALTAQVKVALFSSPSSTPVKVNWAGGELGAVPAMAPAIDASLDPAAWMTELALELLKADGDKFYEARRPEFTAALRAGLDASQQYASPHRFINLDVPSSPDTFHALVFLAPREATTETIIEALSKAVESAILDKAVREEVLAEIVESTERLDLTWTVEGGGQTYTFDYVRVELKSTLLWRSLDPSAFAALRVRLGSELMTGLVRELPAAVMGKAIQMGFGLWGGADADTQVQHYYDMAVRAWNHRDLTGAPLRWDDPANNAFDGDMGYEFDTNEEWAMFYVGRAVYYLQGVADPYYTIPDYKPKADLYAFLARKGVSELGRRLIEKKATAAFGKVVGGAHPITAVFAAAEVWDWIANFARYSDARAVNEAHRPNFGEFTAGRLYDYPMSNDRKSLGAYGLSAGYPFRGPADFLLHDALSSWPMYPRERGEHPAETFSAQTLLDAKAQEFVLGSWVWHDWRRITRDVANHAAEYIHPGLLSQSDKRVPEGAMIVDNPYIIREVFSIEITDGRPDAWWNAEVGAHLRLVLFDGSVIEGQIAAQPLAQPVDYNYQNTQMYIEDTVWVYVLLLEDLHYIAGPSESFGFYHLDLIAVRGDEKHLYAVFDQEAGVARNIDGIRWTDLPDYFVGMAGNASLRYEAPEQDGAAAIAADRLEVGALATRYLLGSFALDAPAYQPPIPAVCPSNAVCAALASPATLHVRDRSGRHVGPNAVGGVDLEISGSRYFTSTETGHQLIVVPEANLREEYKVRVEGVGSGSFDLDVFYSDSRHDLAYRQAYVGVPVAPGTVAEVAVQVAEQLPLRLDETGDGAFDGEVIPVRTFEVAVVEPSERGTPWAILISGVGLIILGSLMAVFVIRRWRRRRCVSTPPSPRIAPPGPPQASVSPSVGGASQTCVRCGQVARPSARFCLSCGAPLAASPPLAPAVCPRCGMAAQRSGARFCRNCGGPLV